MAVFLLCYGCAVFLCYYCVALAVEWDEQLVLVEPGVLFSFSYQAR